MRSWFGNQMHMVGHQAPGPDGHPFFGAPLGHQIEVDLIIVIAKKGLLPTIAPLGDVMRHPWDYDTGDSGHALTIAVR